MKKASLIYIHVRFLYFYPLKCTFEISPRHPCVLCTTIFRFFHSDVDQCGVGNIFYKHKNNTLMAQNVVVLLHRKLKLFCTIFIFIFFPLNPCSIQYYSIKIVTFFFLLLFRQSLSGTKGHWAF